MAIESTKRDALSAGWQPGPLALLGLAAALVIGQAVWFDRTCSMVR